jgi:hypothetical protein
MVGDNFHSLAVRLEDHLVAFIRTPSAIDVHIIVSLSMEVGNAITHHIVVATDYNLHHMDLITFIYRHMDFITIIYYRMEFITAVYNLPIITILVIAYLDVTIIVTNDLKVVQLNNHANQHDLDVYLTGHISQVVHFTIHIDQNVLLTTHIDQVMAANHIHPFTADHIIIMDNLPFVIGHHLDIIIDIDFNSVPYPDTTMEVIRIHLSYQNVDYSFPSSKSSIINVTIIHLIILE